LADFRTELKGVFEKIRKKYKKFYSFYYKPLQKYQLAKSGRFSHKTRKLLQLWGGRVISELAN